MSYPPPVQTKNDTAEVVPAADVASNVTADAAAIVPAADAPIVPAAKATWG